MKLVPVPDIISYLSQPLLPPIGIILLFKVNLRALVKPAFGRQLHARSIRPCFSRLPRGVRIIWSTPPCSVRALRDGYKTFCKTITRSAVFLYQCPISNLTVIVDFSKQGQPLAREPDCVVVELGGHQRVNWMSVSVDVPIFYTRVRMCIGPSKA